MKVTIDSKTGEVKVNGKLLKDAPEHYKTIAEFSLRLAYQDNYPLTDYEEDCMWMSYRYCIGRHTIASHMHASDIWKNCKGRMSKERQLFTAFDINREIEQKLNFGYNFPNFYFPITSLNRIYTPAVDIVCKFIEEFDIKSEEDFCKYKDVHIKLYDNIEGYTFEVTTWEEWLRPEIHSLIAKYYGNPAMSEDYAWNYYQDCLNNKITCEDDLYKQLKEITNKLPNPKNCYMHNFEDLFVWNDLVHCFDYEHHHKSILTNGEEVEWFWSWTNKTEQREDGYYYRTFGYKYIRVPVDKWNGSMITYIPDESIEKNIY